MLRWARDTGTLDCAWFHSSSHTEPNLPQASRAAGLFAVCSPSPLPSHETAAPLPASGAQLLLCAGVSRLLVAQVERLGSTDFRPPLCAIARLQMPLSLQIQVEGSAPTYLGLGGGFWHCLVSSEALNWEVRKPRPSDFTPVSSRLRIASFPVLTRLLP